MSYAAAAAAGPAQSPEEARAPPPPQIEHDDSLHASLVDVDSPHVLSVSSEDTGKTDTQAKRLEREAEDAEKEAKAKFDEISAKASKDYHKGKAAAEKKAKQAKASAKEAGNELKANRDNPVVIANGLVIGLGAIGLGIGAYRKYQANELTWKIAGAWAGVVGLFAAGDYYLSEYLFKNKFPRK